MNRPGGRRFITRLAAAGLALALLAAGAAATAAEVPPPAPSPGSAGGARIAPLDLATAPVISAESAQALADATTAETGPPVRSQAGEEEFRFNNRRIATLRANVSGLTPAERAAGAARRLERALDASGRQPVSVYRVSYGAILTVGPVPIFAITDEDLDEAGGESIHEATVHAREQLERVVREATEEMLLPFTLRAIVLTIGGALLAAVAILLLRRLRARLTARLSREAEARLAKARLGHLTRSGSAQFLLWLDRILTAGVWTLGLGILFLWLTFALQRFPFTRPWGEQMGSYLVAALQTVGTGIVASIPKLLVVLVIGLVARLLSRVVGEIYRAIEDGRIAASEAMRETAQPTRRMLQGLVWIFALVLAFPYLPGSDSAAFRGVSVMLGVIISLGSAGIVGQVMSGLVLMYSRAVRPGDYVRIGQVEGTVTELSMLSTKLRTNRREEVTIPNTVVVAGSTTNYQRHADEGVLAGTTVTIGYDTPWRQVHALLLAAAERTPGLRRPPEPRVLQTALSDFYVEYTLLVCLERPELRVVTLATLHEHIQDLFNEHDVQIMSPHYEADPVGKKVVPQREWFAPPARPPE
ncbi:MAG: mechanosensitive ion channel family protein [Acidobacteria bacterium]|jgi:small-conductance mechanosensitive channel|nr:mechanosensitive ion channel family protein [Acidobacteriota bacterium]